MSADTHAKQQTSSFWAPFSGTTVCLISMVTLAVGTEVAAQWRSFSTGRQCLAVILLLNLIVNPIRQIRSERAGRSVKGPELIITSYVCLFLATYIFAEHFWR
jgi:hypothetical protein